MACDTGDRLATAFALFKPRGIDAKIRKEGPHKEVADYVATLSAQIELAKRKAAKSTDALIKRQEAEAI